MLLLLATTLAFPHSGHPTRAGPISPILPGAAQVASEGNLLWRASAPRFNLHYLAHAPTPLAAMERAATNRARQEPTDGYTTIRRPHSIGHPRDRPQVGAGNGLVDWKKALSLTQRATMGAM